MHSRSVSGSFAIEALHLKPDHYTGGSGGGMLGAVCNLSLNFCSCHLVIDAVVVVMDAAAVNVIKR